MSSQDETVEQTGYTPGGSASRNPGVIVVLEDGKPSVRTFDVRRQGLELGRGTPDGAFQADERASRRHVSVRSAHGAWSVEDLGSRNGTYVNGERIEGKVDFSGPVLIRLGHSLVWAVDDVTPYRELSEPAGDGPVVGGLLRRVWEEIAVASRAGDTLLIRGESGSGKELAARRMHDVCFGRDSAAPFVAVNCAAIPEGLAERLLFGAKRGAYSGATTDAQGYVAAADGGSLFLDEIAELDPLIQAKLLRVLETREVLPLGESKARPVRIRVCAATHENLREAVSAGRFRQDLYFRMGRPEVTVPPLRARIDELPWLIWAELQRTRPDRVASASFVEACALRPWPGNIRELQREVRLAAHATLEAGSNQILAQHLAPEAGRLIKPAAESSSARSSSLPTEQEIQSALAQHQGNVTRAARALGIHRNQLRRWLSKRPGDAGDGDAGEAT
jgi:transcriptional regulator of acetoin/glycerol metabolism